ncbi:hypothetical protein KAR29_06080 [Aminithiophilus ramosus]|uniref:Fucosyltransferase C-terminal domain-containing protein n=1 Tax=Aminithiophilus ramosus TaxID=3029084 RepID=A0A9Q7AB53_9BACT|nr:glycosyltransferase family 10 [Aminithiophilus ramosus]QTX33436.1 hypothetical protein KAR29_06080 [Aminithiophilus ramosus]
MSDFAVYSVNEVFNERNALFDPSAFSIGDDLGAPFRRLRERLESRGHRLDTPDMRSFEAFDGFLFLDLPEASDPFLSRAAASGKPLYLVLFECEIIKRHNWDLVRHRMFRRVFTWSPRLTGERYRHYFWPNPLGDRERGSFDRKRLCVLMASNKYKRDPRELYSERARTIRWFAAHHPGDLDLYGPGWGKDRSKALKFLLYATLHDPLGLARHRQALVSAEDLRRVYRGVAPSKREAMRNYRFSICYENARSIAGYVTEKIFDSFLAGVVPVYLGWENVTDWIDGSTFIDRRDFADHDELHRFLSAMDRRTYETYLGAIESFLDSPQGRRFDVEAFAGTVADGMVDGAPEAP